MTGHFRSMMHIVMQQEASRNCLV